MQIFQRVVFRVVWLVASLPLTVAAESLNLMTTELPPYSFAQDGNTQGISTDILRQVLAEAGVGKGTETIDLFPWARLYKTLLNDPNTLAFSLARTKDREPLFQWIGPITTMKIGLIASKDSHIVIESMDDLYELRIGIQPESAPAQLLMSQGVPVESFDYASTAEQNLKKLLSGRIDVFGFSLDSAWYIMKQIDMNPQDFEAVYILSEVELYFAMNAQADPVLVGKLQRALEKLKQGRAGQPSPLEQIIQQYVGIRSQ
ncbi:ABC transporter substrate-binding protein [Reinekea sp. G2M2-21]|uniref:substrate-binding periplasmic protein n=1 Tax=Reinekea sp. G2M2-21 TaxID=2788942 RepID=UPI0018AC8289|nr:transporter substrate-binding domain-containing protein [Reinekea sp. G2M2-21]